jgi:hypothetical protein
MLQPSLTPSLAERLAVPKLDFRRLATRIISEPQLIQSLFDIIQSSEEHATSKGGTFFAR